MGRPRKIAVNPSHGADIYLKKIREAMERAIACQSFLKGYTTTKDIYTLESAVLQVRKAFECMAFAAIAPNKPAYQKLREKAEKRTDFRKDFHARKILRMLSQVNRDFYPIALLPAAKSGPSSWHFDRKPNGFLTKKKFESFYDRLGKFLHADNPWGNPKGIQNLVTDLPAVLVQFRGLLELHCTFVRLPRFSYTWVVTVGADGEPHIICGETEDDFVVE